MRLSLESRWTLRMVRIAAAAVLALAAGASSALFANCGPFTDVAADNFCPFVLEIFYLGITTGTTPTTYDPAANVSRLQMAAFLSRTVDGVLKRGSRRAVLEQFWTTQNSTVLGLTTVGTSPEWVRSDGADLWVSNFGGTVSRVRASDGKLQETWTGASNAVGLVVAMGRVLVSGETSPGQLYRIDPTQAAGAVTTVASNLGNLSTRLAFDGARVWVTNTSGSVSIVTPTASIPWTVTTVSGFSQPAGIVFDGANIWMTDLIAGTLLKLDANGAVLQTVTVGAAPVFPTFDGSSIWVPNSGSGSLTIVRASSGAVLATLTGNGMSDPVGTGFDGQRILVSSFLGNTLSLFKAADLTSLGSFSTGAATNPKGICNDGVSFWVLLNAASRLARF